MRMCVATSGRNFLFPTLKHNPRLPTDVGLPGLLLRANVESEWKGEAQTVFVGLKDSHYKYVGEYRLRRSDPLSAEEYRALSPSVSITPGSDCASCADPPLAASQQMGERHRFQVEV